jgi:hypothetical protein
MSGVMLRSVATMSVRVEGCRRSDAKYRPRAVVVEPSRR